MAPSKLDAQKSHRHEPLILTDIAQAAMMLGDRLQVFSVSNNGNFRRDASGKEFLAKSEWLLRSVFERLVTLERAN
jgi:hypothetical protein